ncbi:hypothetical protein TNCV_2770991 [Trichonephila clavipes]|nr:hypothetical protein TNCV_2770991 [Trichonephila clavipes]
MEFPQVFPTCVKCSASQASLEYIFDCLELSKQDLYEDPLIVLDFLRVNEIMDLIYLGWAWRSATTIESKSSRSVCGVTQTFVRGKISLLVVGSTYKGNP